MQHINPTANHRDFRHRFTVNSAIEPAAWMILRKHCPIGSKKLGAFLSRLIFEHEAREEAREEVRHAALAAQVDGGAQP
jgi:hypothetical protein